MKSYLIISNYLIIPIQKLQEFWLKSSFKSKKYKKYVGGINYLSKYCIFLFLFLSKRKKKKLGYTGFFENAANIEGTSIKLNMTVMIQTRFLKNLLSIKLLYHFRIHTIQFCQPTNYKQTTITLLQKIILFLTLLVL